MTKPKTTNKYYEKNRSKVIFNAKFYKKKDVKKNYVNIVIVHFEEMDFEPIPRQLLA